MGVPASYLRAVAREESAFDPVLGVGGPRAGPHPAHGPDRPALARRLRPASGRLALLHDSRSTCASAASSSCTRFFGRYPETPAVVPAAYNAGEHAADRWIPRRAQGPLSTEWVEEHSPTSETRRYTRRVRRSLGYRQVPRRRQSPSGHRKTLPQGGLRRGPGPRRDRLRVHAAHIPERQRSDRRRAKRGAEGVSGSPRWRGAGAGGLDDAGSRSEPSSFRPPTGKTLPAGWIYRLAKRAVTLQLFLMSSMSFLALRESFVGTSTRTVTMRSPRPRPSRRGMPARSTTTVSPGRLLQPRSSRCVPCRRGWALRPWPRWPLWGIDTGRSYTKIVAVAVEQRVRLELDGDVQVAGGAAEVARVGLLPREPE